MHSVSRVDLVLHVRPETQDGQGGERSQLRENYRHRTPEIETERERGDLRLARSPARRMPSAEILENPGQKRQGTISHKCMREKRERG